MILAMSGNFQQILLKVHILTTLLHKYLIIVLQSISIFANLGYIIIIYQELSDWLMLLIHITSAINLDKGELDVLAPSNHNMGKYPVC